MDKVEACVKFILAVVGFDVGAELVKGFVVFFFFEVGEFVYDNHTQKFKRGLFEKCAYAYLVFAFDFVALETVGVGVKPQCVVKCVDGVVVDDFAKGWRFFEIVVFDLLRVVIEGFVGSDRVQDRVALL